MTLVLTAVCDDFVVQVSDRRFGFQHGTIEATGTDEANKQVVVNAEGFRLVAGFAGLAIMEGELWSTSYQLAEVLVSEDVLRAGFDGCVEAARVACDLRMERFSKRQPLSIVFAGFTKGIPAPHVATVSNCKSPTFRGHDGLSDFEVTRSAMSGRRYWPEGMVAALPSDTEQRVRLVLKAGNPAAVVDVAVDQIRRAAKHAKYGKYVGVNCMSVCVLRDGPVEAIYHAAHKRAETFGPTFVEQRDGFGSFIMGSPVSQVFGAPPPGVGPMPMRIGMSETPVLDRRTLKRVPKRGSRD